MNRFARFLIPILLLAFSLGGRASAQSLEFQHQAKMQMMMQMSANEHHHAMMDMPDSSQHACCEQSDSQHDMSGAQDCQQKCDNCPPSHASASLLDLVLLPSQSIQSGPSPTPLLGYYLSPHETPYIPPIA